MRAEFSMQPLLPAVGRALRRGGVLHPRRRMASLYDDRALEYVRMTPKRVAFKEDMLRFDPRSPAMTEKVCFSAAQRVPFFNLI